LTVALRVDSGRVNHIEQKPLIPLDDPGEAEFIDPDQTALDKSFAQRPIRKAASSDQPLQGQPKPSVDSQLVFPTRPAIRCPEHSGRNAGFPSRRSSDILDIRRRLASNHGDFGMEGKGVLYLKSLREQVYDYLREAINRGELEPGSFIDQNRLSAELGTSRTPLRDALIQLETEGFVSILPRRGVRVNRLLLGDIRHLYEIIGALEGVALMSGFERIAPGHTARMESLNEGMRSAVAAGDFDTYYNLNLAFHDVFLGLSDNHGLLRTVEVCKQRLYDFPRERDFVREWELTSTDEHSELVRLIDSGEARAAADFLRDVHWSYEVQQRFIVQYYHADEAGGTLASSGAPLADLVDRGGR